MESDWARFPSIKQNAIVGERHSAGRSRSGMEWEGFQAEVFWTSEASFAGLLMQRNER